MKHIQIIVVLLFINSVGFSQMRPAKQIPPDVKHEIIIKAPIAEIWDYITVFDNFSEYAGDIVLNSKIQKNGPPVIREVTYKDGRIHKELILAVRQLNLIRIEVENPEEKFLKYLYSFKLNKINKSKCQVAIESFFSPVDNDSSEKIKKEVSKELRCILDGLKHHFEK